MAGAGGPPIYSRWLTLPGVRLWHAPGGTGDADPSLQVALQAWYLGQTDAGAALAASATTEATATAALSTGGAAAALDAAAGSAAATTAALTTGIALATASSAASSATAALTAPGQTMSAAATCGQSTDANFGQVSTLLHFDGANNSTTLLDATARHAVVASGAAKLTTADSKFGGSALLLDGSASWASISGNLSDFVFGTGDFCVEAWVKTTDTNFVVVDFFTNLQNSWQIWTNASGKPLWYAGDAGGNVTVVAATTTITDGNWHHVRVARSSGTTRIDVDGVTEASASDTRNYSYTTSVLTVGAQVAARNITYDLAGVVDDVRITKGAARAVGLPAAAFPDQGPTPALTTSIRLAAGAVAVASGTAALPGTAAALAAAATGVATVTSALSTGIALQGGAATTATATAALASGAAALAAAATTQATATTALTTGISPAAQATAQATASAALTTSSSAWAATGAGQAVVTAALTTGVRLAGVASASTTVTASLVSGAAALAAALTASASASAALTTAIRLAGDAAAQSTNTATLTALIRLLAQAQAGSNVSANLAVASALATAMLARSTTSADLSTYVLPFGSPYMLVSPESNTMMVGAEGVLMTVAPENQ